MTLLDSLPKATSVDTAPVVAVGLIGGFLSARVTKVRPIGGLVLAAAGAYAGRTWQAKGGTPTTAALATIYTLGFGLSHPLAKKIGAWPSVLTVTAVSATAAHFLSDAKTSQLRVRPPHTAEPRRGPMPRLRQGPVAVFWGRPPGAGRSAPCARRHCCARRRSALEGGQRARTTRCSSHTGSADS